LKILIINVNSSEEYTKVIDGVARNYATPSTEITTVKSERGKVWLGRPEDREAQVKEMSEIVQKNMNAYDGIIYACGVDIGLNTLKKISNKVIGIGEASIFTACAIANRFSILLVTNQPDDWGRERLRSIGINPDRCASSRTVGDGKTDEIVARRHELRDIWYQTAKKCVEEDGADAIINNCAMSSDLKEWLEDKLQVPVISGVIAAVKIAEQLPNTVR
jgi:Asp/Glu/hydantoin racemase